MTKIRTQPNIMRRAIASIIDYGFFMIFLSSMIGWLGTTDVDGSKHIEDWPAFALLLTWFIYFPGIESIRGQTLGHWLMKLRVVTISGNNISFTQALKRRLLDGFEVLGGFGLVAYVAVKNNIRNQRVGDQWAKTLVVGGETRTCLNCHEKLTLTAEETIANSFICPECGTGYR